ncbi:MAG: lactate utilization protein [Candidatus Nomurabacteria bacterium]|nr:lactate utilization protein [Candidatus Nomurabacteria bacterium]
MEYNKLKTKEVTTMVIEALAKKNVQAFTVESGKDALEKIKELIPTGASVMNGASVTLEQIGFVDYLKSGEHGWNNLHEGILAEKDPAIQASLRKQAVLSDYYLGSVHALTETGEYLIASNSGSQLPHIVFTSANLIFVVSTKKIVPNITEAMNRLMEYIMPIEDKHMKEKYGVGTVANKILIVNGENGMMQRKVTMILVNEDLGF